MAFPRPPFQIMWQHFVVIYGDGSVPSVGKKIGGKVQENIELGVKDPKAGFTNACGIRMSYSLNNSGVNIPRGIWKTVSGGDKRQYIYRVADLIKLLPLIATRDGFPYTAWNVNARIIQAVAHADTASVCETRFRIIHA